MRCANSMYGAQCVTDYGIMLTHELCVSNSDCPRLVSKTEETDHDRLNESGQQLMQFYLG